MKKLVLTLVGWIPITIVYGQDAKDFYLKGIQEVNSKNYEEAIKLFSRSIELHPTDHFSWYNRAICKSMLNRYEEALEDFDQVIKLAPDYKKGYLNRGTTRKRLTDYDGSLADYTYAIQLDSDYPDAYYNRGLVYEMLGKKDSACADFNKSNELGLSEAKRKVEKCSDTAQYNLPTYSILRLTKAALDRKYGFTEEYPIKVGAGPEGGAANQRMYLNLLRDAQGKPIQFKRIASCCPYKTENGIFGMGMLDKYLITYLDENGNEKTTVVYISFYDYEEPQILFGFKTVGKK